MAINAYVWGALSVYTSRNGRLLLPDLRPDGQPPPSWPFLLGTFLYTAAIAIALLDAFACLAFHGALALWYAFDPLGRRSQT